MPERELDLSLYDSFAAALRAGGFMAPADPDSWSAELVAAHVIMNNDFWTSTARDVVAGAQPTYDNEPAVDAAELTQAAARIGALEELAAEVMRSARDLASAYVALSDDEAARPVMVTIHHEGDVIVNEPRPIAAMLESNAAIHQRMHLNQLLALRGSDHDRS
jgi:hypothetical protein